MRPNFSLKGTSMTSLLLVATFVASLAMAEPRADSDNVCVQMTTRRTEKRVQEPKQIEIKYQTLCGILPCTKTRYETTIDSKLVPIYENVQITACCPGYAETPDRRCAPICLNSCNNGKCIKPGVCECHPAPTESSPGFVGSYCNRYTCLAPNRWGSRCERECDCTVNPNSYCSASTGKCQCRAGWRGANCTEECEPSMNCADVELPPIIEPEVNLILGSSGAEFQRLEALEPSVMGRDLNPDGARSVASLVAAHMGLNLFLTILTFTLFFAVFWYRRRFNKIRNELYYSTPYSIPPSSSSTYSDPSLGGSIQNRPRMPIPGPESSFLGKNLDFASATREMLTNKPESTEIVHRNRIIVHPKVESHLMTSQKLSDQNIYSDVDSAFSDRSTSVCPSRLTPITENATLSVPASVRTHIAEDNLYQVPRSPENQANSSQDLLDRSHSRADQSEQAISFYEGTTGDQSNIYEEIKPRY